MARHLLRSRLGADKNMPLSVYHDMPAGSLHAALQERIVSSKLLSKGTLAKRHKEYNIIIFNTIQIEKNSR